MICFIIMGDELGEDLSVEAQAMGLLDAINHESLPENLRDEQQSPLPKEYTFVQPTPEELDGKFYIVREGEQFCKEVERMKYIEIGSNEPDSDTDEEKQEQEEDQDDETDEELDEEQGAVGYTPKRQGQGKYEDKAEGRKHTIKGSREHQLAHWDDVVLPEKTSLTEIILSMVRSFTETNIKITIGFVDFYCHQIVLKCFSQYFNELSTCFHVTLPAAKVTPLSFYMTYKWMIDTIQKIPRYKMLDLYSTSLYLGIDGIKEQCWYYLDNCRIFYEASAFELFLESYKKEHEVIKKLMLSRVSKYFLTLVASDEFLKLSKADISHLFSLNSIGVNSEAETFLCLCYWMLHEWEERKVFRDELFNLIRYELIDPTFCFDLQHDEGNEPIRLISQSEKIAEWFEVGISYASILAEYGKDPIALHKKATKLNITVSVQRQWTYDKSCPYHNRPGCKMFHQITYEQFINFLKTLIKLPKEHWKTVKFSHDTKNVPPCPKCYTAAVPKETKKITRKSRK